jgi:GNAT superfamily N-acetyltransferase
VPSILVRTAAEADLEAVLAVLRRTVEPDVRAIDRATWSEMLATPNLSVHLAELDGQVAGTATLLVMPNLGYDCHPSAFIEAVVVSEPHRRKGVGAALIERVLAEAADRACRKVQLLSHKRHRDDGAFAFYESLGFTAEAEGFRRYLSS